MEFNLYEFPEGWTGPRRYVSVRGHIKSIAQVYTYKGVDGYNYVHPEYGGTLDGISGRSHLADTMCLTHIPDISAFRSPIDGTMISSRSQLEQHQRDHNVIQVGDADWGERQERAPLGRVGPDIKQAIDKLATGYQPDVQRELAA